MPKSNSAAGKGDFDIQQLATLFPATLGGWTLAALGQPIPSPMPEPLPALEATYTRPGQLVNISLMTSWPVSVPKGSRAIEHRRVEVRTEDIAMLPLSNGIVITARSHQAGGPALAQLIEAIDLDRAEKLVRARK